MNNTTTPRHRAERDRDVSEMHAGFMVVSEDGVLCRYCSESEAAFIVRACNSHEALVAALKEHGAHDNDCAKWDHDEFDVYAGAAFDDAVECTCGYSAALKLARGES